MSLFQADVQKLQTHPATLTITKQATKKPLQLTVGAVALEFIVERMLSNGRAVAGLPALLQSLPAEVQALVLEFLQGTNVADRNVTFAAPTFLSLDDARRGLGPTR